MAREGRVHAFSTEFGHANGSAPRRAWPLRRCRPTDRCRARSAACVRWHAPAAGTEPRYETDPRIFFEWVRAVARTILPQVGWRRWAASSELRSSTRRCRTRSSVRIRTLGRVAVRASGARFRKVMAIASPGSGSTRRAPITATGSCRGRGYRRDPENGPPEMRHFFLPWRLRDRRGLLAGRGPDGDGQQERPHRRRLCSGVSNRRAHGALGRGLRPRRQGSPLYNLLRPPGRRRVYDSVSRRARSSNTGTT